MKYIASFSGGKDSTVMVIKLMELNYPLDEVIFYDTGMEFKAIYNVVDEVKKRVESNNIKFTVLKPEIDFWKMMLIKPVKKGEHYGYDWCGGQCRWGTSQKTKIINDYLKKYKDFQQYIGIAVDEQNRIKDKIYPLVEWNMTEKDCLKYCYDNGIYWTEGDIELYDILDRVSCWCCGNKNLKELRNIHDYLPEYWGYLKGLQTRIDRPYRRSTGETIFDLEKRFINV